MALSVSMGNVEGLTAPSGSTSSPPRVLSRGKVEGRGFNAVEGSKEGIGQEKAKTFSPDILAFKRTLNIEEEELFRPTSLPWEA
jgi:hypothetical protein